tara:strand:- start:536 stop:739 length:204 start_codon:yes stop_codon:yes gene_type:complete
MARKNAPYKVLQDPVPVMGRVERTVREDAQALGLNVSEIIREAVNQAVDQATPPRKPWRLWKIPTWK